jgi:hypothetical protein
MRKTRIKIGYTDLDNRNLPSTRKSSLPARPGYLSREKMSMRSTGKRRVILIIHDVLSGEAALPGFELSVKYIVLK